MYIFSEFDFATDKRLKNHDMQTRHDKLVEKNHFERQLRSSTVAKQVYVHVSFL